MKSKSRPFRLKIGFWGVRGSAPTPSKEYIGFGGNTSCIAVETGAGEILILDAGSGIRDLGLHLTERSQGAPLNLHLFLSHFHWDHLQGFPFFQPIFGARNCVTIYSSQYSAPLGRSVTGIMAEPYFPVKFETLPAQIQFVEMTSGDVRVGSARVAAFPVKHPQGACGYRIEADGAVVVYSPDREPGDARLDHVIRSCSQGADLLIHDAQYTRDEYQARLGWGHSPWMEAVQVARDSQTKRLVLFHHDPAHNDRVVSQIVEEAKLMFPNTQAAREGDIIEV